MLVATRGGVLVSKFNPTHDQAGRFARGSGSGNGSQVPEIVKLSRPMTAFDEKIGVELTVTDSNHPLYGKKLFFTRQTKVPGIAMVGRGNSLSEAKRHTVGLPHGILGVVRKQ